MSRLQMDNCETMRATCVNFHTIATEQSDSQIENPVNAIKWTFGHMRIVGVAAPNTLRIAPVFISMLKPFIRNIHVRCSHSVKPSHNIGPRASGDRTAVSQMYLARHWWLYVLELACHGLDHSGILRL